MARKRVYSELEEVDTLEEVKTASNMTVHETLTQAVHVVFPK